MGCKSFWTYLIYYITKTWIVTKYLNGIKYLRITMSYLK